MGGTPSYPGSGKSIVTAISPLTHTVVDSNVGGYFGPYLKFSGFDAMVVQEKCDRPTVVFIDGVGGAIQLFDASELPEDAYALSHALSDYFAAGQPRSISVVSAGPGAVNTLMGCLNFTWYDSKRKRGALQTGRTRRAGYGFSRTKGLRPWWFAGTRFPWTPTNPRTRNP